MKSKPKPKISKLKTIAILHSSNKEKKLHDETAMAIRKKLDEIKKENSMPSAVNNNLSLFRYKV